MNDDKYYMSECLKLAEKGKGHVSPNPLVGCVIVKDGTIIGRGYHKKFGDSHAEVNALLDATEQHKNITGSTLYVNLEPCAHYGKTPPCTDIIIRTNIKRVVAGISDPNPIVNGKGLAKLKAYGIEVKKGILEPECYELNKFFVKYIKTGYPYITLKAAQTINGMIADRNYKSKWISSEQSRKFVHKLRSEYDAVLVGKNTVHYDDPTLTVRMTKGRNPYRIVADTNFTLPLTKKIFTDKFANNTILITSEKASERKLSVLDKRGVKVIISKTRNGHINLQHTFKNLGKLGISSIMVEGGSEIFNAMLKENLADEMLLFTSPKFFKDGVRLFATDDLKKLKDIEFISSEKSGTDILNKIKFN